MRYFGGFKNVEDVRCNFASEGPDCNKLDDVQLEDSEVLLASYGGAAYEGDAFVIFMRDGKLYEAHGSHCSCNGLEGQWRPEETSMEALEYRLENANLERFCEEHGEDALEAFKRVVIGEAFEREVLLK